jgi:hypothetical protein
MKRFRKALLVILSIVLWGTFIFFVQEGNMTTIKVTPSKSPVKIGESFSVNVEITPDVVIGGGQLNFGFNPAAMRVDSVVQGPFLGSESWWHGGTIDNVAGTVKDVYGVVLTPGQGISTKGIFVTFNCTALAAGKPSNLALTSVVMGNLEGVAVPFDLSVSQVAILSVYDLDSNGVVDVADLVLASNQFGLAGTADYNADGIVNVLDLIIEAQNFTV